MPTISKVGPEARARLVSAAKGPDRLQPDTEAIRGLAGGQMIEVEPEDGETLRQVKFRLTRASKQAGVEIRSGETTGGTVLVWLADSAQPVRRRRRRRGVDDGQGQDLLAPQKEMPP